MASGLNRERAAALLEATNRFLDAAEGAERTGTLAAIVDRLASALDRAFQGLGREFLRLIGDELSGWPGAYDRAAERKRGLFIVPMTAAVRSAMQAGAQAVTRATGTKLRPSFLSAVRERVEASVTSILETTKGYVATVVEGARGAVKDTLAAIRDRFRSFGRPSEAGGESRTRAIAGFEVGDNYNGGQQQATAAASAQGIALEHAWRTMQDDKVEADCEANERAGWLPVSQLFPSGHARPKAHYRCRCWLLTRVAGAIT